METASNGSITASAENPNGTNADSPSGTDITERVLVCTEVKTYAYAYNGSSLTQEAITTATTTNEGTTTTTETLNFAYDASGTPMSVSYNGVNYYYAANLQGDVAAILDAVGTAVVEYTYDAWGNPLTVTGSLSDTLGNTNSLRYRGYVYDNETGFYYVSSRYYNPETGRFVNADIFVSTGLGVLGNNMFAYCNNNPILFADATGTRMVLVDILDGCGLFDCSYIESLLYSTEYNSKGALYEYWDDPTTGDHVWSRHHTDHGYPKYHENPHDHQWHKDDDDHNKPGPPLPPNTSFKAPNSKQGDNNSMKIIGGIGCAAIIGYGVYVGVKWTIAIFAAPATAGGSLVVAGVTP